MAAPLTGKPGIWTRAAAGQGRWLRLAVGFIALSYALGAPLAAVLEFRHGLISQRFDLPQDVILLSSAIQLLCAVAVLFRRTVNLAAAALTIISMAAAAAHFRIGSPVTAIPALVYTVIQVWIGIASCTTCQPLR